MPLIDKLITAQQFELIRDRIGEILADEVANQIAINGEYDLTGCTFWVERFLPYGKEELPAINVRLAPSDYQGGTVLQADGNYTYHVEAYVSAPTEGDDSGDVLAAIRLQRLLGICRSVLMNNVYITLGFEKPSIVRRSVAKMELTQMTETDGLHTAYGRLVFNVQVPETSPLKDAVDFAQNTTKVKLNETNKGYQLITTQPTT